MVQYCDNLHLILTSTHFCCTLFDWFIDWFTIGFETLRSWCT